MTLTIDRLTGNTGAVVSGIRLADVGVETVQQIEAALLEHLVLFFPDQALEPAEQLHFAAMLGTVDVAPFGSSHAEVPQMTVLDQTSPRGDGADAWHTDNSFRPTPPSYTMLQSVTLPEYGGDTCWSNMYEAYETLSAPMQRFLDPLTATHDLTKMLSLAIEKGHSNLDLGPMQQQYPPEHHPVVRTHPQTGRKALFVNGNFTTRIDGLADAESTQVLELLLSHVKTPDFHCRFRWEPGALALWDNRCLQHYAVPDYDSRRVMHRLMICGDRPR